MKKVITYGTYDLLHHGHIRLLERAKALGDYLIVGVTADDFDMARGKINVRQSLMERVEAVRRTGLADQIIIEEYEGQKIDDIRRYGVDIFIVGSDWKGKFDYLNEFCKVVYLERTQGVSSTELRSAKNELRVGLIGETVLINKFLKECGYVNGIKVTGILSASRKFLSNEAEKHCEQISSLDDLCSKCDAVYIASVPELHYEHCKKALESGLHVLCESPFCQTKREFDYLMKLAHQNNLVLMDGIKTAYSLAFNRLILLVKGGIVGDILSVDSTCTSLRDISGNSKIPDYIWNSISYWGPTALLPIFNIFGTDYYSLQISSKAHVMDAKFDIFTNGSFIYKNGVASFKVGQGVKSEGEMIISGTKGYIYVPAPWWKTDYFEVRYENPTNNKRYFYHLDGEGIRYEIRSFLMQIEGKNSSSHVSPTISEGIVSVMEKFNQSRFIIN